jgi:hypothetical protein
MCVTEVVRYPLDFHSTEYPKRTLTPFESCDGFEEYTKVDTVEISNGYHIIKTMKVTCP